MALDYITLASNIDTVYTTLKNTTQQDNPNQVPYPSDPGTIWMDNYVTLYDNDANNGVFSASSVVMTSLPLLLTFDNTGSTCSGPTMMAAKISEYWQAQVTPGTPQIDSIISVSNDAAKIQATIETYLCSRTSIISSPSYQDLFLFIENAVKSIIWTVTETGGSYTVTIS